MVRTKNIAGARHGRVPSWKRQKSVATITPAPRRDARPTLGSRIQGLPQELQDMVLEFTLLVAVPREHELILGPKTNSSLSPLKLVGVKSHTPTSVVFVDPHNYKPPLCLQLSRKTREKFAKQYYSSTTFYVRDNQKFLGICSRWLRSLTRQHRDWITEIFYSSSFKRLNERFDTPHPFDIDDAFDGLLHAGVATYGDIDEQRQNGWPLPALESLCLLFDFRDVFTSPAPEEIEYAYTWCRSDWTMYRPQKVSSTESLP